MLRCFLAGIMQGSHRETLLHDQDYRARLKDSLMLHLPSLEVYDPLSDHTLSLEYDEEMGRQVFFGHNKMCREIDVLIAFVPEASMGTAVEMWEAYTHGKLVLAISGLKHNWAIRFLSHALYDDLAHFEQALAEGEIARHIRHWEQNKKHHPSAADLLRPTASQPPSPPLEE